MIASLALLSILSGSLPTTDVFLPAGEAARWGFRRGIQVALHPEAIGTGGDGGPRGLLRIGYPILPDGGTSLINFIAVEPVVRGRTGYSELERSSDGRPGKRITPTGVRRERKHGCERLTVSMDIEPFGNGAHVLLDTTFDSSRPDEVELRAYAAPGSATMEQCVLTATMGNYQRLRRIHLADSVLDSSTALPALLDNGFTRDLFVSSKQLACDAAGDIIVPATTDEFDPSIVQESLAPTNFWRYPGLAVTQYWRAPRGTYSPALTLRLNGRRTYWMSRTALPGGTAFENFELRDRFRPGQSFGFGVTSTPPELLLAARPKMDERMRSWLEGWN